MFSAIVIDKGEAGQSATLTTLDEEQLLDGDVSIDVEYSTLNYKDGLAITGQVARRAQVPDGARASISPVWSPRARMPTGRRATASCSTVGVSAKPIGAASRSGHA